MIKSRLKQPFLPGHRGPAAISLFGTFVGGNLVTAGTISKLRLECQTNKAEEISFFV